MELSITSAKCHQFNDFGEFSFYFNYTDFGVFSFGEFSFGRISLPRYLIAPFFRDYFTLFKEANEAESCYSFNATFRTLLNFDRKFIAALKAEKMSSLVYSSKQLREAPVVPGNRIVVFLRKDIFRN